MQAIIDSGNLTPLSSPATTVPAAVDPTATTVPGVVDPSATTLPGDVATVPVTVPVTEAATTVPPPLHPLYAIGESVMLGAAPQLQAGGFVVDATKSRQGEATADVIGQLAAAGQLGETVVIQVGTNGPVSDETYDRIMSYLPADAHPNVVFLTVHAPSTSSHPRAWISPNNQRIFSLPGRYPNVKLLDWDGLATSGQVPGLAGDGIHLGTKAAKQTYANFIFDVSGHRELVLPIS